MVESECFMNKIDNLLNGVEEENIENEELQFRIAPVDIPREFIKHAKTQNSKLFDFHKGTTTLAFKFKEGIIVAVDSRASMGSFISSQCIKKIIEINKNILGTMAGGAADCLYWQNYLAKIIKIYELRNNDKISVRAASTILSNIFFHYKGYGLCCGIILSGYDHTGFNMFYIDDEGKKVEGDLFSCGSGSTYAYSILDAHYDFNLNLEQAVGLAKRAIYHATFRDAGSGGLARVYYIHKNGYDKIIEGVDVYDLHYEYSNPEQKDHYVM